MMIKNLFYSLIKAIRVTDIIKFMKPAIINLIANFSRLVIANTAEIAKGNTIVAVIKDI